MGIPTLLNLQKNAIIFITASCEGNTTRRAFIHRNPCKRVQMGNITTINPETLEPNVYDNNTINIDSSNIIID